VNTLKKLSTILLALVFSLALVLITPVQAKRPLIGQMDLQFNLAWPGPQKDIPDWVGTITLNNTEYGMAFFCYGSGKPFDTDPPGLSVHFFAEIWTIYEWLEYEFDENGCLTVFNRGPMVLNGTDEGITSLINTKYHMTGKVTEAFAPFTIWHDRNVYMSGLIEWYEDIPAPHFAPGTFRIN
jgi:hypothetical protein